MKRITTTPFGQRPVSACLIKAEAHATGTPALPHVNKYEILRLLSVARKAFAISDRDLGVLAALASFSKGAELRADMNLVVFPSNRVLSERAHGMPESTLRRHLAALVKAGLILRHDSPNGKRYVARTPKGGLAHAFGFDLRPLLVRAQEIALEAEKQRVAAANLLRLREAAVLALRDAGKLIAFGIAERQIANWDALSDRVALTKRMLRRKLNEAAMRDALRAAQAVLEEVTTLTQPTQAPELSGTDGQNERHQYSIKKEYNDSESCLEKSNGQGAALSLRDVLVACPDIANYHDGPIRHWHQVIAAAAFVRTMMGIGDPVWQAALSQMGADRAAIVVAVMLERFAEIENPGGYLTALTRKANIGGFTADAMITALLKSKEKAVA